MKKLLIPVCAATYRKSATRPKVNVASFHSPLLSVLSSFILGAGVSPISGSFTRAKTSATASTIHPMMAYGVLTSPPPAKRKNPPTSGPQIHPSPLNDCARFSLRSLPSGSPSTVTYGFAAVSRQVSPHPITKSENRKNSNEPILPPGMKSSAPTPYSTSPVSTPARYPKRRMMFPAGSAMMKYPPYTTA